MGSRSSTLFSRRVSRQTHPLGDVVTIFVIGATPESLLGTGSDISTIKTHHMTISNWFSIREASYA